MESSSAPATTSSEAPLASNPPSTTYVQTDARTFKEVVQRLTGLYQEPPPTSTPIPKLPNVRRPAFKLHERRVASRPRLSVLKPLFSPRPPAPEFLFSSPGRRLTPLVSPSTQLSGLSIFEGCNSPMLPLPPPPGPQPPPAAGVPELNEEEEEKAIRERRFYLHPSPRSRPRIEPELLALFPLTSSSDEGEKKR